MSGTSVTRTPNKTDSAKRFEGVYVTNNTGNDKMTENISDYSSSIESPRENLLENSGIIDQSFRVAESINTSHWLEKRNMLKRACKHISHMFTQTQTCTHTHTHTKHKHKHTHTIKCAC